MADESLHHVVSCLSGKESNCLEHISCKIKGARNESINFKFW